MNQDFSNENWIDSMGFSDFADFDLYICAIYFTVTTIVTVGYGDISPKNTPERCFVIILMLIGVMSFSFTTGAIASIIASIDSKETELREKMTTLSDMQKAYGIDARLFNELTRCLQINH